MSSGRWCLREGVRVHALPLLVIERRPKVEDTKFMTAQEKEKVLRDWERFLRSGCAKPQFTKALYQHLINHCSFIAHYDLHGFYSTYFEEGEDTIHFLSQFDNNNGTPKSVEYGMTYWYMDPDYNDLNSEMCRVASLYIPVLTKIAKHDQIEADTLRARALLAKHGLKATIAVDRRAGRR